MINEIKKYKLCLGCGLCSSVLGSQKCKMQLMNSGFYEPNLNGTLSKNEKKIIKRICPAIHIESHPHKGVWGAIKSVCEAWSADETIRHKAASGGVVTSLALYLLESKSVDAILHVGKKDGSYLFNELQVSRTREDVIKNAQSRYAPALVFSHIKDILDSTEESFAFIGKPCDIAGMQNFCREFPSYKKRIKYYISIFCAGTPSYNATKKTWQLSGHQDEPISLSYRGDGWPGNFKATFKDGSTFQLTYNESWGKILGRDLGFRCKICPDGIGMLADIAVGDSWKTKDGYPDFTESDGRCFCFVRTENGQSILASAISKHYIDSIAFDISKVKEQQAYQYQRRKLEGWRLVPIQLFTKGILHFKGLSIFRQAITANIPEGFRNMMGSFKRFFK